MNCRSVLTATRAFDKVLRMEDFQLTVPITSTSEANRLVDNLNKISEALGYHTVLEGPMARQVDADSYLIDGDILVTISAVMMNLLEIEPEESTYEQLILDI